MINAQKNGISQQTNGITRSQSCFQQMLGGSFIAYHFKNQIAT